MMIIIVINDRYGLDIYELGFAGVSHPLDI